MVPRIDSTSYSGAPSATSCSRMASANPVPPSGRSTVPDGMSRAKRIASVPRQPTVARRPTGSLQGPWVTVSSGRRSEVTTLTRRQARSAKPGGPMITTWPALAYWKTDAPSAPGGYGYRANGATVTRSATRPSPASTETVSARTVVSKGSATGGPPAVAAASTPSSTSPN